MGYSRVYEPVHEIRTTAQKIKRAAPKGAMPWILLAGIGAIVAVGFFVGPDLLRYIKIKRM